MTERLFPPVEAHVIDANLFIAFERTDTVHLLERVVTEHEVVLSVPSRVYEELTPADAPVSTPPVDAAIDAGWVRVVDDISYAQPLVSKTMDMVRRYIAAATGRPEHEIEQADAEVGGVAAHLLEQEVDSVAVYTNDIAAFRGIERALDIHGYGEQVTLVRAAEFVDAVHERYEFSQ